MDEEKIAQEAQEMENVIVVDDGYIDVPIRNQLGDELGVFRFNPTDFNIIKRYKEVRDKFDDIVKPLTEANISVDGEGEDDESTRIITEAENNLIELMNYMLGGNAGEAFFSKTNAFTPTNGEFYCARALDAIGQFIARKFSVEIEAMNKRVGKHTHGYRTGKHKKGRE